MSPPPTHRRALRSRPVRVGFTLVEAVISSLLVGLVMIAALRCVGAVVTGRMDNVQRARGTLLAQALLSEIYTRPYRESGTTWIGLDSLETHALRGFLDDVDDYDDLGEDPPRNLTGQTVLNTSGWRRDTSVNWVNPQDPDLEIAAETGVKKITVTVKFNGATVAVVSGLVREP